MLTITNRIDHHHDSCNCRSCSCNAAGSSSLEKDIEPSSAKARPRVRVSEDQARLWKTIQRCKLGFPILPALGPEAKISSAFKTANPPHWNTTSPFPEGSQKQKKTKSELIFLISLFEKTKKKMFGFFRPFAGYFRPFAGYFRPSWFCKKMLKNKNSSIYIFVKPGKPPPEKALAVTSPFSIPSRPRAIPATPRRLAGWILHHFNYEITKVKGLFTRLFGGRKQQWPVGLRYVEFFGSPNIFVNGPQFGIIPHIPCWHFQQNEENVLLGHHLAGGQYHVIIEICITMTWLNPTRNVQRAQEHLRKLGLGINEVKSMLKDLTRKANWIQSQMKQRSSTQHEKNYNFHHWCSETTLLPKADLLILGQKRLTQLFPVLGLCCVAVCQVWYCPSVLKNIWWRVTD